MTETDAARLDLPEAPAAPVPDMPPAPPAPEPAAPPTPRRTRRVGTLTMGIVLILTGACLCAGLLRPGTDFTLLLKLSPLVLVALGCEVVLASFQKDVRLKYDFLSMLVCLLLIGASLAAACIPAVLRYASPARQSAEASLEQALSDAAYAQLRGVGTIDTLQYSVSLSMDGTRDFTQAFAPSELASGDYVAVHVTLHGGWDSEAAFAAACRPILDAVCAQAPRPDSIFFESRAGGPALYMLNLSGPYQYDFTDAQLAAAVERQVWVEENGCYMSAQDAAAFEADSRFADTEERADEAEARAQEAEMRAEEAEMRAAEAEARVEEAEARAAEAEARAAEIEEQLLQMES